MTLDQIRSFLEVAYCRSFSAAAQRLYISQPNLTKSIAAMEKEIGTRLFDRTTRRVELTEAGEQLLTRSEALFVPFLHAYDDFVADIASDRKVIKLGVSRDERLPDALVERLCAHNLAGGIRIVLLYDSPYTLNAGLQDQRYNMIISSDRNARMLVGTDYLVLQQLHMLLAVSRHHPLAEKPDLAPADLKDETLFFSLPKGIASQDEIARSLYHRVGTLINVTLMDSPSDVLGNVRIGGGAAIIPDLADLDRYPDIRFVPFNDRRSETDIACQALVWRADETEPEVLALLDELRELFPEE